MSAETDTKLIAVEIMGKQYHVPDGMTVIGTMWYTGHNIIRGVGCLGGVCGACSTVYRTKDDFALKVGLGCQMKVEDGMSFFMTPFYPAAKPNYKVQEIEKPKEELFRYFPEALNCRNCNACNKVCPQDIDIKGAVKDAVKGDFAASADKVLSCVMCGLCVSRCIAEMAPNMIALYARRTYSVFYATKHERLDQQMEKITGGEWNAEWENILALDTAGLKEYCKARR
ncbi:MAG: 4Fe-4S dicluster domain-containing protein [Nitrospirota bacterium]|nr:4Fe-4S dicluster domain-containing protein [Nitrospirota bacterium]